MYLFDAIRGRTESIYLRLRRYPSFRQGTEHGRPIRRCPEAHDVQYSPLEDKSLWFNKVNEDYGSFTAIPEAQKKVDELIKGKKTEMEKIAVLTHWVADNIRYSGISMGKGEGFTLHNLKMNYTDRCGVCKDIAGTLIAFLRMAGFEAYPAMTMAGSRVESIPADHFNHCVAVVKLASGTYMPLDPTWVPFCRELWSSAEQQQNYLRVCPKLRPPLNPSSPPRRTTTSASTPTTA